MFSPVALDGRSLVVIRPRRSRLRGYEVTESGRLEHDGKALRLVGERGSRTVTESERVALKPVAGANRIRPCRGFDFFLLLPPAGE